MNTARIPWVGSDAYRLVNLDRIAHIDVTAVGTSTVHFGPDQILALDLEATKPLVKAFSADEYT